LEYLKTDEPVKALHAFLNVLASDGNYVGTYYHLARTYEKLGQQEDAVKTYEKGILIAKQMNDMHARNELQMALDDLIDT
jgi:tetratricopeptide (TPR) repeat protein